MAIARETYVDIGRTVREQILKEYAPDSCIPTARATLELLKGLRAEAYAMPVICMVVNRPLWEYADTHGGYPAIGAPDYPEGGYGLGVGFGLAHEKEDGKWGGHLVVIAERRWLLDYSIDQATRGQHGIMLGPLVIPVTEKFLRRTDEVLVWRSGDTRLHYAHKTGTDANAYKTSDSWIGEHAPTVHIKRNVDTKEAHAERRRLVR